MPEEKIGSNVIGKKRLPPKLTPEQSKKLKEAVAKLKDIEEKEKLPKLPIPGETPHEKKLGETGYNEIEIKIKSKRKKT